MGSWWWKLTSKRLMTDWSGASLKLSWNILVFLPTLSIWLWVVSHLLQHQFCSMGISWTPSIPREELGKETPYSRTCFCCVWSFWEHISLPCVKRRDGIRWRLLKMDQASPMFFYVDDLMLFAKANSKNCDAILEVLDNFCNMVGQKVNLNKSRVYFSPNVTRRKKRTICKKLGMVATQNLGRYLGFQQLHQGRNGDAFNFVIEKIQNKLAGWKSKLLSIAGKLC